MHGLNGWLEPVHVQQSRGIALNVSTGPGISVRIFDSPWFFFGFQGNIGWTCLFFHVSLPVIEAMLVAFSIPCTMFSCSRPGDLSTRVKKRICSDVTYSAVN